MAFESMSAAAKNLYRSITHVLAALFNNRFRFEDQWEACHLRPVPGATIEGCWEGEWVSEVNGHHGLLRSILTQTSAGDYQASFHATYSKVLRVCYSVELKVNESHGPFLLKGEADLGRLAGGVYHYEGEATPDEFRCDYRCKYDHGTFRMARPRV